LLTNALDLRCVPRALDAVLAHARHWRAAGSVSIRTIEHLIASGELRAVRVRRSVRVTPEALDAYISGLPCQSANAQVASKSVSASRWSARRTTLPAGAKRGDAVALEATLRRAVIDQV